MMRFKHNEEDKEKPNQFRLQEERLALHKLGILMRACSGDLG